MRDCNKCPYFYECDNMGWYENEVCLKEQEEMEEKGEKEE